MTVPPDPRAMVRGTTALPAGLGGCRCECHLPDRAGARICGHVWDGPEETIEDTAAGEVRSVTCSRCGLTLLDHQTRAR